MFDLTDDELLKVDSRAEDALRVLNPIVNLGEVKELMYGPPETVERLLEDLEALRNYAVLLRQDAQVALQDKYCTKCPQFVDGKCMRGQVPGRCC